MIIVMASLILYGDITFAQVPVKSQPAVKAHLNSLGYDEHGQPLPAAQPAE
ncbi:CD1375 family protein [Gorillibacterium sp. sgz500922]|uniref:CD1375 family protein n=1 Tax=Gorillibacterium sp. sgz500922 TaxID=3446694 RepID=UPI003F67A969